MVGATNLSGSTKLLHTGVRYRSAIKIIVIHSENIRKAKIFMLDYKITRHDVILRRGIMMLFLCTETVALSSRRTPNLSNFYSRGYYVTHHFDG